MTDPCKHVWDDPVAIPVSLPSTPDLYPDTLPHDLALCFTPEEVEALLISNRLTMPQVEKFLDQEDFKREYTDWRNKLTTEGISFKLKLRAMAEEYLPKVHQLMNSELTSPAIKVDLFKYITKTAELEPKKEEQINSGPAITIEIRQFGGETKVEPKTVNIQSLPQDTEF